MFPKFLLKRMYEKGSLKTNEGGDGFNFIIKNSLANGNVVEVFLLSINGSEVPFNDITIKNETQEVTTDKISPENPVELKKGVSTLFKVKNNNLTELFDTQVKIQMKFKVAVRDSRMTIDFEFEDLLKKI